MLDSETPFLPDPDAGTAAAAGPLRLPAPAPAQLPATGVTPRRPLRFTFARTVDDSPALPLPLPDLFEGVFDSPDRDAGDDRIRRSRARARALLDAREAALDPAARNLWHDDGQEDDTAGTAATSTLPAAAAAAAPPAETGRRRIRHLTAADLARDRARRNAPAPQAHEAITDPLRDRLRDVRCVLYSRDDDMPAHRTRAPLPERLTAMVLTLVLLVAALPVGLALGILSLFRGPDLRLSAQAVTVVGIVSSLWHGLVTIPL